MMATRKSRIIAVVVGLIVGVLSVGGVCAPAASAAEQTFQEASNIQSGRWEPQAWFATEIMLRNSLDEPLFRGEHAENLDTASWHRAPGLMINPGETIHIEVEGTGEWVKGLHFRAAFHTADYSKWFVVRAENPAGGRNSYQVWERGLYSAAVDGWNNAWVPKYDMSDKVDSDVIGRSNWAVVAFEVAETDDGAGGNLPKGEWSSDTCGHYASLITGNGFKPEKPYWSAWYESGAAGAAAGAMIGYLANRCW